MSPEGTPDEAVLAAEDAAGSTTVLLWVFGLLGVVGLGFVFVGASGANHLRERSATAGGPVLAPDSGMPRHRHIGAAFGRIAAPLLGHLPGSAARTATASGLGAGPDVSRGGTRSTSGLEAKVLRVADASGVDPTLLRAAATDVRERTRSAEVAGDEADIRRWSESRLAAWSLPVLPVGLAVAMLVTTGGPTGLIGWSLLGLALVAMVFGVAGIGRLPRGRFGFLLDGERAIADRLQWFDQVAETLDTAQLYAAAGAGGSEAIEAAAPVYVAHPVRRLLEGSEPVTGPAYDPSEGVLEALVHDLARETSPVATQQLLGSASTELRERYCRDLERRDHLVRRGILVAFVGCLVPVALMLGAAFSL